MDDPASPLIKTADLLGLGIFDHAGHKVAMLRELFLDPATGHVQFVVLEVAALLGNGGKFHPIPWAVLSWNAGRPGYDVPFDKDRLKAGPAYDRDQINSTAYGWQAQVQAYYA